MSVPPSNQLRRWNESVEPLSERWAGLFKKRLTGYALIVNSRGQTP